MAHITVVYARRDEPQSLVDGLRANLAWCDSFVEVQRPNEPGWNHEGDTREACRQAARAVGAEWTLWMDPDERMEDRAAEVVRAALKTADPYAIFAFHWRELWTPTAWRKDGMFGAWPPMCRLWRLHPEWQYLQKRFHCSPVPINGDPFSRPLDLVIWHLKNIEPANRVERRRAYLEADPTFEHQSPWREDGWDFLLDDRGLELEEIEPHRMYSPVYVSGEYTYRAPGTAPS